MAALTMKEWVRIRELTVKLVRALKEAQEHAFDLKAMAEEREGCVDEDDFHSPEWDEVFHDLDNVYNQLGEAETDFNPFVLYVGCRALLNDTPKQRRHDKPSLNGERFQTVN